MKNYIISKEWRNFESILAYNYRSQSEDSWSYQKDLDNLHKIEEKCNFYKCNDKVNSKDYLGRKVKYRHHNINCWKPYNRW